MTRPSRKSSAPWFAGGVAAATVGLMLLVGGLLVMGLDSERDSSGYISGDSDRYHTPTYALSTKSVELGSFGHASVPPSVIGRVRVKVDSSRDAFVGIARASDVDDYLGSVAHQDVGALDNKRGRTYAGVAPQSRPSESHIWVASHSGSGPQTLDWKPRRGKWRLVVMNADGGADVSARVDVGAEIPHLALAGAIALVVALGTLGGAVVLVLQGRSREREAVA